LIKADLLLLKIKKREELLNRQLFPKKDKRLFQLIEEINALLIFYQEIFKQNNIGLEFKSLREYRIFANQDQLLRIINTLLLNTIESLILSKQKHKLLKIYFKRTPYLLKIYIEDNAGLINNESVSGILKVNCFDSEEINKFKLALYFANQMMKKYFNKKIEIQCKKFKKTVICIKIKNFFILAEPKINQ